MLRDLEETSLFKCRLILISLLLLTCTAKSFLTCMTLVKLCTKCSTAVGRFGDPSFAMLKMFFNR